MNYSVRFVHKISPRDTDLGNEVQIQDEKLRASNWRNHVAKVLRDSKNLLRGDRLREGRIEADGRIVVFPAKSIWHSLILTPKVEVSS